jgi:hypothetical protein
MRLIATIPNSGQSDKLYAIIDPFSEMVELFGFGWSKDIVGITGIVKTESNWIMVCQNKDQSNGVAFLDLGFNLEGYFPLRKVKDAHSILFLNDCLYVVSSGDNSIYKCKINYPTKISEELYYCFDKNEGDNIHLNSITLHHSGVIKNHESFLLTFFGEKNINQEGISTWRDNVTNGELVSIIFNNTIIEKYSVKKNLSHPHTAKIVDTWWLSYCESYEGTFVIGDKQISLGGYTRGMAYDDSYYYVGISESRNVSKSTGEDVEKIHPDFKAAICIISRDSFELVKRFDVSDKLKEIYDIEIVK